MIVPDWLVTMRNAAEERLRELPPRMQPAWFQAYIAGDFDRSTEDGRG